MPIHIVWLYGFMAFKAKGGSERSVLDIYPQTAINIQKYFLKNCGKLPVDMDVYINLKVSCEKSASRKV